MNVTQWHGCYSGSWNGILVPDAFAHPAKVAPGLSYRIYRHMIDAGYIQPGDSVIDPFGGIGGFGYHALLLGLHWTGVELEPRFVELGQRNLDKWRRDLAMLNGTLGTARLLQGDSRRLLEVVGAGMAAAVSSPPYEVDALGHSRGQAGLERDKVYGTPPATDYGDTPGQLGSMPTGDYAAAVSSPPFGEAQTYGTAIVYPNGDRIQDRAYSPENQGQSPGNLAALRADDAGFTAAVSSPPYADNAATWVEGPGARFDSVHHNGDNAYKQSSANGYGNAPGQLGRMAGEGFEAAVADAVVSSPPYAESLSSPKDGENIDEKIAAAKAAGQTAQRATWGSNQGSAGWSADAYGSTEGQLGSESPDTFWSAARVIVEQTYQVLRPGGYAAWVTKCFVRKGQIVPFSDQWEQLCAAVGFEPVERIAAMLVDDHGDQLDIFGGATARRKERKSFFRRLAEAKGSPRIDHEDVIIMRKPVTE